MPRQDFDSIINEIAGNFSPYHILLLICCSWLGTYNFFSCQILQSVFTAYKQKYICKSPNATDLVYNSSLPQCYFSDNNHSIPCTEWIFDQSEVESTIRSQFSLVCSREWMTSLAATCLMIGFFLSNYIFGSISDSYGRHVSGCIASIIGSCGAFGAAFVPDYWMFCLLRFFVGAGVGGLSLIGAAFTVESCYASKRIHYLIFTFNSFCITGFLFVGLNYAIRNHITVQLICASFGLFYLFIPFVIPESPRWLLSKGYNDRAYNACKWIARINRKQFSRKRFDELCSQMNTESNIKNVSLWKILTKPHLRKVTFVIWWGFAVASFVYYILSLGSGSLGNNIYLNMTIMFASDILVRVLNLYVGVRFGRVPTLVVTYFGAGIFILMCGPIYKIPGLEHLLTVFSLIGRTFISMTFDMIWMYAADVYPTVARSSGVGSGSAFARVGSLLSPQLENLSNIWIPLPFIISGVVPIIAAILCWMYMPETSKMPTMDYLDSVETFLEKNEKKFLSKKCLCFDPAVSYDDVIEMKRNENNYENEPLKA